MRSLLERQIRKHLTDQNKDIDGLTDFLNAIQNSYTNYEDQLKMVRRAMAISSDELFEANKKLTAQAKRQNNLIHKLKEVINTLSLYQLPKNKKIEDVELDGEKLAKFIDDQTKQIVEANRQKEELLINLETQNQELNEYAHIVSHDLKSPLRSIDALTNWFLEDHGESLNENGREAIQLILNNVEKMEALINGILNYSTISKAETNVYDVDTNLLVKDIINIIYKPEHINIKIKGKLPVIEGDKYRLQQLFQNLLDNAVNYIDKPEGIIEIGVINANPFWEFYIRDNGLGIPKEYHTKIFQVFQKLKSNDDSTGLGLSIVKKVVDYYGGNIRIESKEGEGTTFFFTLPKK